MVRARSAQLRRSIEAPRVRSEFHAAVRRRICSPSDDDIGSGLELKVRPTQALSRPEAGDSSEEPTPRHNNGEPTAEESFHGPRYYTRLTGPGNALVKDRLGLRVE